MLSIPLALVGHHHHPCEGRGRPMLATCQRPCKALLVAVLPLLSADSDCGACELLPWLKVCCCTPSSDDTTLLLVSSCPLCCSPSAPPITEPKPPCAPTGWLGPPPIIEPKPTCAPTGWLGGAAPEAARFG
ncbi:hypothetical protein DUNSADRAFT_18520 [Dunaliella salina]|uniref:Encoded protein n=1 Tax=Dunaliella salina TaxID=3046 RepID=A0ABQ7FZZ6_DUNSA|nr:hypothetical protein DUNSADRAFT_18520 [Dunaliella salina]|eukprot:KAF5827926.1 hypothetical protein DUNSADRAFT_18520 [Dunaliella salina]